MLKDVIEGKTEISSSYISSDGQTEQTGPQSTESRSRFYVSSICAVQSKTAASQKKLCLYPESVTWQRLFVGKRLSQFWNFSDHICGVCPNLSGTMYVVNTLKFEVKDYTNNEDHKQ